jgi:hypothetical protein
VATGRRRSRRVSLPGVAELLRPAAPSPDDGDLRPASGREKHAQKITVYLSAEELLDLERARLALLRYGAAADRGRIVREAIAVLLADLDARGQESLLARRIARSLADADGDGDGVLHESSPDEIALRESTPAGNGASAPALSVPHPSVPDGDAFNGSALSVR